MVERRLGRIEGHMHSIEDFRRRALGEDNKRQAARAEESIIHLDQEVAALLVELEQQGEEPLAPAEQTQMARQHILAINSDPEFLNIVRVLLSDERYNVTTTNFVPNSFDQIAALKPALLLIDLAIGDRAGWDLLERLHLEAVTQGIPVIAVSSDPRLLDRVRADTGRFGVRRFLIKPLNLHRLLAEIDELIGQA